MYTIFFLTRVMYFKHLVCSGGALCVVSNKRWWWIWVYLYRGVIFSGGFIGLDKLLLLRFFSKKLEQTDANRQHGLLPYINLITFYEQFFASRLFIVNRVANNSLSTINQGLATKIYLSVSRLLYRSKIQLRWYSFIYIFVWACANRDLTIINNYLTVKIRRMHFKKHKKFFSLLRYVYFCTFKCLLRLGLMKGFLCKISGKIGLAGSVKTKSLIFAYGRTRLSNKNGLVKTTVAQIWTRTGVLGLRMYLVY